MKVEELNKQAQAKPDSLQMSNRSHPFNQWATKRILLPLVHQEKFWLNKKLFPIFMVLIGIAITASIFIFSDTITELSSYGYLGVFLASLVSNATIILPVPASTLMVIALGTVLSPLLVGLVSGTGAAIGEMSSYIVGYSGRSILKNSSVYDKSVQWLRKWGPLAIFTFTITPLPLDIAGIAAGALHFPLWKFFLACWFGKTLLYTATALAGAWGWEIVLPYIS